MHPIKRKPADLLETTGRRIEKDDAVAGSKIRCYHDGQRVLLETDDSDNDERAFVYGNYIDEVLIMTDYTAQDDPDYYYGHDHLHSMVVIFDDTGAVYERAEYNAYGEVQILSPNYAPRTTSLCGNPYYFTGRRRDSLDSNNFKIYYYRARYYDAETGRFLSRDPLGVSPSLFGMKAIVGVPFFQYRDGLNVYMYVRANPIMRRDTFGLSSGCSCDDTREKALDDPRVKPYYDTAMWMRGGTCLRGTRCGIGNYASAYHPDLRFISINESVTELEKMVPLLLHELVHAIMSCGEAVTDCQTCLEREITAAYIGGQCGNIYPPYADCFMWAWQDCAGPAAYVGYGPCHGQEMMSYYDAANPIAWPVETPFLGSIEDLAERMSDEWMTMRM